MTIWILSFALHLPGFATDRIVEEQFLREYPAAADRLDAMTRSVTGTGKVVSRRFDGTETRDEVSLSRRPGYYLYVRTRPSVVSGTKLESTLVMCQTPTHWFRLTREAPTQPYSLDALKEGAYRTLEQQESFYVGRFVDLGKIESVKVSDLIKMKGFRITGADEVDRGDERVVEIRFILANDEMPIRQGRLVLAPRWDWALMEYEIIPESKEGGNLRLTRTMEYRRRDDSAIVPTKVTLIDTLEVQGEAKSDTTVMTFEDLNYSTPPERQFSLSAFNVPEISLRPKPRSSFFSLRNPILWAGLVVSVASFAALGVLRKRLSRG